MKLKEILKLVCEFVGEKEMFSKLENSTELSAKEKEKFERMVRCFNLVNQEIASEYIPYLCKENVSGSIINFSQLSKKVINIFQVKGKFGLDLLFKVYPNFIEVQGNAKSVTYSFLPEEITAEDDVQLFCGITARVLAYGVASEYLLLDGVSQDAEIWENRFKQSLFVLSRKKGEHVLPKRRWL